MVTSTTRNLRFAVGCLLAVAFAGGAQLIASPTAHAVTTSDRPPMTFAIVRDVNPECSSSCAEWIEAEGDITAGTAAAFKDVLAKLGNRRLPVFINSEGGVVSEALAVGRLIRAKHLDVVVSATELVNCGARCSTHPDDRVPALAHDHGASCDSACVFILAAGQKRYASPFSRIGVHQIRSAIEVGNDSPANARVYEAVRSYLAEMGIGSEIMALMLQAPATAIRGVNSSERRALNLITDEKGGEQILASLESIQLPATYFPSSVAEQAILDPPAYNFPILSGKAVWSLEPSAQANVISPVLTAKVDVPRAGLHLDWSFENHADHTLTMVFVFTHTSSNMVASVSSMRAVNVTVGSAGPLPVFGLLSDEGSTTFKDEVTGSYLDDFAKEISADNIKLSIPLAMTNQRSFTLIIDRGPQSQDLAKRASAAWAISAKGDGPKLQ